MNDSIFIGLLQLEHRPIEVTAAPEGTTAIAWIERLAPAPCSQQFQRVDAAEEKEEVRTGADER